MTFKKYFIKKKHKSPIPKTVPLHRSINQKTKEHDDPRKPREKNAHTHASKFPGFIGGDNPAGRDFVQDKSPVRVDLTPSRSLCVETGLPGN